MTIGNMPEDELDDLFRLAASEVQPEYDAAAWTAMERKLDDHDRRAGFWRRVWWLSALFLTMGVGFYVSQLWLEHQQTSPAGSVSGQLPPEGSGGADSRRREPLPGINKAYPSTNAVRPGQQAPSISGAPANPGPEQQLRQQKPVKAAPLLSAENRGRKKLWLAGWPADVQERKSGNIKERRFGGPSAVAGSPAAGAGSTGSGMAAEKLPDDHPAAQFPADAAGGHAPVDTLAWMKPVLASDSLAQPLRPVNADSTRQRREKKFLRLQRLALTLQVAPDLSAVGFANPGGISTNAGVTVSYQLSERWLLGTGLVLARKVYGARPEDYGKADFWRYRNKPSEIEAVCRVLDIPVLLGYQVRVREKSAIRLFTGISSYLMLREDYEYYYANSSYTRKWSVKNQNRHLFGIYNLSGQYIRQLNPGLALGVEPFVKVPLTGVGAGKVKLASAGTFFSLSFRFP